MATFVSRLIEVTRPVVFRLNKGYSISTFLILPPMSQSGFAVAATAFTLGCSSLSMITTGLTLVCYMILPFDGHFRHVLIINLMVSSFIASLGRTISGIQILATDQDLDPGPLCNFGGLINQVFGLAADCSVFAISVFTVFTVTRTRLPPRTAQQLGQGWQVFLTTCCIWAFALFTGEAIVQDKDLSSCLTKGFLALGMKWYAPATGNGCWLKQNPATIRILIATVPKWSFVIAEILLYVYLNIFLHRHYKKQAAFQLTNVHPIEISVEVSNETETEDHVIATHSQALPQPVIPRDSVSNSSSSHSNEKESCVGLPTQVEPPTQPQTPPSPNDNEEFPVPREFETIIDPTSMWALATGIRKRRRSTYFAVNSQHERIQKILLLNAYPLGHILLSIPPQVNRAIELSGHTNQAGEYLQGLSSATGFANALTFAWNERVIKQLKKRFGRQ